MSDQPALTELEHRAVEQAAELWDTLTKITNGPDLAELYAHIHAIQNAMLAQAAARAYPDRYRLLTGSHGQPRSSTACG